MKFLSLKDQMDTLTAAMQAVFGTALLMELIEHPDPLEDEGAPQQALRVDSTYIISCGEHLIDGDDEDGAAFSYLLERNVYLPGTREQPPDWDVAEIGPYRSFYECARVLIGHIVSDRIDNAFQCIAMDELAKEVAEESACKSSGSE